jgi:RNA polymerase sigma factor (sigma-70 family)
METPRAKRGAAQEQMNPGTGEQANREHFFSQVSSHLGPLYEHVRHQIAYLESTGDLVAGEVNVEDVVDTVLLRAFREFGKRPEGREIGSWLIELADGQLGREVKRSKAERRTNVHIEKDIPEVPPVEEVKTLGEEIFEYYQPDEDLKLEDVFPEMDVSSPEDFVATKEELLRCINAALAGMPQEWRRALRLRHTEGLRSEELSEALDKDEPEIEQILEYAREHLRQSLIESGCTFILKKDAPEKGKNDG